MTTTAQVIDARTAIAAHKAAGHTDLLKLSAVNVSFTFQGLTKVSVYLFEFFFFG